MSEKTVIRKIIKKEIKKKKGRLTVKNEKKSETDT